MGIFRRLPAVLPLLALALAGCGGGDGDDSTAAPAPVTTEATVALSKEELVAQGDAICAEVNAAVGTVGSTSSGGEAGQVAGLYSGMVERLKGLGAPSDDSGGYAEFIASAEALAQAEDNVKLASEREEGEALSGAEAEASSALSSFQASASAFGLAECAEAPAPPTPVAPGDEASGEEASEAVEEEAEEAAPEEAESAPETGGAEEESAGGGAGVGGGTEGGGSAGGGSSGGIGPG